MGGASASRPVARHHPGGGRGGYPGGGDLVGEVNDLLALLEMLEDAGLAIPSLGDRAAIAAKKARVERFLRYSAELGRLSPAAPRDA
ncbi:hypothetical protein J2T57_001643 [Natronocella acetinitrilica]|uniref:Uncharacterized protein n=1 Tax=Natronocella acetinitrilica TaxID=414046 RepID=A0AAE3KBD4_9GAMM|nr:hypothetical protein [Natronocella acetinitrilica]MCP1674541.1 hypothetical protein [Natronocella acetinitrilica]